MWRVWKKKESRMTKGWGLNSQQEGADVREGRAGSRFERLN